MPVTRRTYNALQARYELALEQRDDARSSLATSRDLANRAAEENSLLRRQLDAEGRRERRTATELPLVKELARLKKAYAALENQLLTVQASNEEMAREAREKAEAAL